MNDQTQRLKDLLSVPTYTWEEDELILHVVESTENLHDEIKIDEIGNIYITKGKCEPGTYYPCFVAHLDTVHREFLYV